MKYWWQILGCLTLFVLGAFLVIYLHEWIIIYPRRSSAKNVSSLKETMHKKKKVACFFWQQNQWRSEEVELLYAGDEAATLHYLINHWLSIVEEERLITKKVTVQSVAYEGMGCIAYVSFDRNLFDKESSCFTKLMIIEGLLKTVREADINPSSLQLLVHHQPLNDYHLDFSYPWSLKGFYEQ